MKVVKLKGLNELLDEFNTYGYDDELFELFLLRTKDDNKPIVFEVEK